MEDGITLTSAHQIDRKYFVFASGGLHLCIDLKKMHTQLEFVSAMRKYRCVRIRQLKYCDTPCKNANGLDSQRLQLCEKQVHHKPMRQAHNGISDHRETYWYGRMTLQVPKTPTSH
jgi:hypothetical protein